MPTRSGRLAILAMVWGQTCCFVSAQERPLAPVAVSRVVKAKVDVTKTFVGTLMPIRKSIIGSAVDGRVLKFLVNEGDAVKANQPLAQLRTATIEAELATAKAVLAQREEELKELQNGSRPEEKREAEAKTATAAAVLDYARGRAKRIQDLAARGTTTADELEDTISRYVQAQKLHDAAKATLDLVLAGPRAETIAQAKARRDAALHDVERIQDMIEKYTIRSPFDGFVTAEHTEEGHWIRQGEPVVEIVELRDVEVQALVLESYITQLAVGNDAEVEVGAVPGEVFKGKISLIVPQADVRSRSFPVKVRLANRIVNGQPLLKAGMIAKVTLPIRPAAETLVVTKDALVLGGETPLVYVVDVQNKASATHRGEKAAVRPVQVKIGAASASAYEVSGELQPGDVVVVRGNERLQPRQMVEIKEEVIE